MISAKMLRESNTEIVCKEMINKDTDITVYKNGYVLYHTGIKCTVFVLPEKGCYSYDSVNVASVLDGEFFENEEKEHHNQKMSKERKNHYLPI